MNKSVRNIKASSGVKIALFDSLLPSVAVCIASEETTSGTFS